MPFLLIEEFPGGFILFSTRLSPSKGRNEIDSCGFISFSFFDWSMQQLNGVVLLSVFSFYFDLAYKPTRSVYWDIVLVKSTGGWGAWWDPRPRSGPAAFLCRDAMKTSTESDFLSTRTALSIQNPLRSTCLFYHLIFQLERSFGD